MTKKSFLIIGAGLVGLGTAYALIRRFPRAKIVVLEKEPQPGAHQSTHNSGVLHAGLYYKPGSLKARLAVEGIRQMTAFCQQADIPHEICGKLVVATTDDEILRLKDLFNRGQANGLSGLRILDRDQLRQIEPHCNGIAALHVPEEGIVDYTAVVQQLVKQLESQGVSILTSFHVVKIERRLAGWILHAGNGNFTTGDFLINCAGLYSDRIARLAGKKTSTRIIPFRGEYYKLSPSAAHLVRNLIYPVPHPAFPFLGVHFTRLIHGGIEAGPNAVLALAREGYSKNDFNLADAFETLTFPGLLNFLRKYPRMCWGELSSSFSKKVFCRSLQKLVPEICEEHLLPGGAGIRAQAMLPDGTLVQDFDILNSPDSIHVLNAPSPAATASLAIGSHIASLIQG
ncbi:MAG: L-2-hydroxyglutarate oxidase [Chthoniobacterales bacterium]|nr:L-2-hydroxyglutarate oxidase [Chthoniobacterales bacterium]